VSGRGAVGAPAPAETEPASRVRERSESSFAPIQTHEILVTLAERPHPFPSRTRKLSSPAPKILRGQPFGKIGRRQDFCVNAQDARTALSLAVAAVARGEATGFCLGDSVAAARTRLAALVVHGQEIANLGLERRRHSLLEDPNRVAEN
jgi:hypothetical protein